MFWDSVIEDMQGIYFHTYNFKIGVDFMKTSAKWIEGMQVEATAGKQTLSIDLAPPAGKGMGMTPSQLMGSAVLGCRIISFVSLARKMKFEFESLEIELEATTRESGTVEGTRFKTHHYDKIHMIYKVKTTRTKEEIEEFLVLVHQLCTVGNALSDDIEQTHEIVIVK